MLRLFLGLFLVMTVGLVLALQTVEHTFNALLDNQMQAYNREAVRGQAWSLVDHCADARAPIVSSNWRACGHITACH